MKGFWLLVMNRADLSASPACPAGSTSSSEIDVPNCGQFFATGAGSIDTNNALANALHAVTPAAACHLDDRRNGWLGSQPL